MRTRYTFAAKGLIEKLRRSMRKGKHDVSAMTVEQLQREKVLRQAWIRDVTGLNRARLDEIEQELASRNVPVKNA